MYWMSTMCRNLYNSWPRRTPCKTCWRLEERKSICILSREMYLWWRMHWCMPNKVNLLDETNELYCRTTCTSSQERSIR